MKSVSTKFEPYKDKKGEFRWRQIHRNGNIIAESGESYKRMASLLKSLKNNIARIKKNDFLILPYKKK